MSSLFINSGVFFCGKIESDIPSSIFTASVKFGEWCLTPIRYLTSGMTLTISSKNDVFTLNAKKGFPKDLNPNFGSRAMRALKVVAAILLLVPGIIVGSAFKGFGYMSQPMRKLHSAAVLHYTPMEIIHLGNINNRIKPAEIQQEMQRRNPLHRRVNEICVWLKKGASINQNYKLLTAKPHTIRFNGVGVINDWKIVKGKKKAISFWLSRCTDNSKPVIPNFPNFAYGGAEYLK